VRRQLTITLGAFISVFFAWLGFRGLNFAELLTIIGKIQIIWLIPAIVVYFIAAYLITWRWHFLLYPVKPVHANRLYPVVIIGYMGNNIYPARIGELVRAYVLKRSEGVDYAPSLVIIFAERVFDGLVMLVFILTALLFVDFDEPVLNRLITVVLPLFLGALAVFSWLALRPQDARRVYTTLVNRFMPSRLRPKTLALAERLMAGMAALRDPRLLMLTWVASIASWTVEASTYWIVLQAFEFEVSFWVLILVLGLANLTTILPSTPGYVGTFHAAVVLTLTAFNVPGESAGAYAIVMHMVLWLPITLVGGLLLWQQGMGWRDFSKASTVEA